VQLVLFILRDPLTFIPFLVMHDLHVVVVGAGIGGLQTSLALAKDGHRVTLLESAKAFEEV